MKIAPTVAFYTLGCKLNYSETSTIGRDFVNKGYAKVKLDDGADVCVINTCSVTENANKECARLVRKALAYNPETFIAIIGCYAQLKPGEIAQIPGVDLVLGANEKFNILEFINGTSKKTSAEIHSCSVDDIKDYNSSYSFGDRTRSFLKVQDGCDYPCTYCTIPMARGVSRSDTIMNAVSKANEISEKGVMEIVLTGVNVGDFGSGNDDKQETFLDLIKELDNVEGIERFRISSIEPNLLKNEIIEFVASSKKFVPHFHIPLQSGSNKILGLMKRRYKKEMYKERVRKIKNLMPHCCIGVDVIVGFPGESHEDFLETYNFLNELPVSYLHVFTYSERPNTEAIKLDGVVEMKTRKERNKMLRNLSEKKRRAFYMEHLHQTREVLFESTIENGYMFGFTDNYIKVKTPYNIELANKLVITDILSIDNDCIASGNIIMENEEIVNC